MDLAVHGARDRVVTGLIPDIDKVVVICFFFQFTPHRLLNTFALISLDCIPKIKPIFFYLALLKEFRKSLISSKLNTY